MAHEVTESTPLLRIERVYKEALGFFIVSHTITRSVNSVSPILSGTGAIPVLASPVIGVTSLIACIVHVNCEVILLSGISIICHDALNLISGASCPTRGLNGVNIAISMPLIHHITSGRVPQSFDIILEHHWHISLNSDIGFSRLLHISVDLIISIHLLHGITTDKRYDAQ